MKLWRALACLPLVAAATPLVAADVTISGTVMTGVNLNLSVGATAEVAAGANVSNAALSRVITATTAAWNLTNNGTVVGSSAYAVGLEVAGSAVTNLGSISATTSNGVVLFNGGTVDNRLGATISGTGSAISIGHNSPAPAGGAGTVTNAGTLAQLAGVGNADTVALVYGGTVTNLATGVITALGANRNAVSVTRGVTERTVTNWGTISSTGTGNATGVTVQAGASTITNYAGGSISGTLNGIYSGSDAPLTLNNAGTISSTNSYAVQAEGGSSITNSGTIQSTAGTGFYMRGTGTIANSGTIGGAVVAIQFGTTNVARTLNLTTGSTLNGTIVGSTGTGIDTLGLQGSGSESLARFSNFEMLAMSGVSWVLTGNGTFSTSAGITAGTLTLDGILTSPIISISSGGTLGGIGRLVGAVGNSGTISPGIGTLSVTGSFAGLTGSIFAVSVTPTTSGLLNITGSASLDGAVRVSAATGSYLPTQTYTILSASTGVAGTFAAGATTNQVFLTPTLSYDSNNVYLRLDRSLVSFTSAGITPNQRATGAGLDSLPAGNALAVTASQLTTEEAPPAFDLLSGELHASVSNALLEQSRFPREAALRIINDSFAAIESGTEARRSYWLQAYGGAGVIAADGNAGQIGLGIGGLLGGTELMVGNTHISIFGGVGTLLVASPDRNAMARIGQAHLGVIAAEEINGWRFAGGAVLTANTVTTERQPDFGGVTGTERSQYWTGTAQLFGEASYAFDLKSMQLRPFARLALIGGSGSSYAERGDAAALSGQAAPFGLALASFGLAASSEFDLTNGFKVTAHASAAVQQGFGSAPTATHRFAGGGDFTVSGARSGNAALALEAGLTVDLTDLASFDLSYSGVLGGAGQSHAVKATLSGRF